MSDHLSQTQVDWILVVIPEVMLNMKELKVYCHMDNGEIRVHCLHETVC